MSPRASSIVKGETLIDTAVTLNAMQPDILVVRHGSSGAASLLSQKVSCSVINAGDGQHEHPSQALLDALSMRRAFGRVDGLTVAICGDILHSRVARSNVALLTMLGAQVRLVGPPTLMPANVDRWGVEAHHDMKTGIAGADVVMMLRLQLERMQGALVPSMREYFRFWGLDREKLAFAAPGVRVMHPGPMNRGVEIDSDVADDLEVSLIQDQVEMGVAVRMAVLASLAARLDNR
jgi:aspartate carbamoyltransferase catalytic subunit